MKKNEAIEKRDVLLIQKNLDLHSPKSKLIEDGIIGKNTITAIEHFQLISVGLAYPDGRVDPNGKTFRFLTLYLDDAEQHRIEASLLAASQTTTTSVTTSPIRTKSGLSHVQVTYNGVEQSKRIVSSYAIEVIKLALKEAGMSTAVITSTIRLPEEQAKIMLKNAKISLKKQYALYGTRGDNVLKVYENNKAKTDSEILSLMATKINEYAAKGERVSKHCVSVDEYKKLNIIDIGLNSTRAVCKNFNQAKFTQALLALKKEGYIEQIIDETAKSNSCWHIEIKPNKKAIGNYNKNSIFFPINYINPWYRIC